MTKPEETLKENLGKVATEKNYKNCEINFEVISTEGANYSAFLYRAILQAPGKADLKMFAKVTAIGEKARANASVMIDDTEFFFYKKLLYKYKQLEEKNKIPAEHRFKTPIFYGGSDEYLKETLILEDLSTKGFITHDRSRSIDWEYAFKCIENLAKLHALSMVLSEDDPEGFEQISSFKTSWNNSHLSDWIENALTNALQVIREDNRDRLSKITNEIMRQKNVDKIFQPLRRRVIIHGDYRPSNMMHRVVDGNMEVVPVDYQTMKIGNPIIDVVYYILNGSDKDFRGKHFKAAFEHYYEELCKALRRFGHNPEELYPREDFDFELKEILPLGLVLTMFSLLVVTVEPEDAPKVLEDIDADHFAINPNTLYIERLNDIVDDYIKMGAI